MRQTSISDNGNYPQFCYLAATHDAEFKNFKRNSTCNEIASREVFSST